MATQFWALGTGGGNVWTSDIPALKGKMYYSGASAAKAEQDYLASTQQQSQARGEVYDPVGASLGTQAGSAGGYSGGGGGGTSGGGSGSGGPYSTTSGGAVVTSSGDAGGNVNLSRSAYEAQQQAQLEAKLSGDAFSRRLAALSSQASPSAQVQHGAAPGFDENTARANAFARAKESAGLNAQAALKSLRNVMESTGRSGSSTEFDRAAGIMGQGRSDVNTFIDKQLTSDLERASQIADTTYQGNITQRGQDASMKQALLGLTTASGRLY